MSRRREWQPAPVFLPRKSHGQRNLEGYSPGGHEESDTAEQSTALGTTGHNVESGENVQLLVLSRGARVNLSADSARCPPWTVPGHEEILFQPDLFTVPLSAAWYIPQSPFCGDALHTVWGPGKTATSWHLCDQ